jgi:hypothetical protein
VLVFSIGSKLLERSRSVTSCFNWHQPRSIIRMKCFFQPQVHALIVRIEPAWEGE